MVRLYVGVDPGLPLLIEFGKGHAEHFAIGSEKD